ncbi:stress response protein NST1 isoform X1 [Morus notabilis]|uniref:stress response protein NST1 isoform X1 n=1 Tax=Morus notabilis TaxID=981085 RepID=UPI000CED460D|nr:stress response protein NST1 isoform X1 [Morus notabilis]
MAALDNDKSPNSSPPLHQVPALHSDSVSGITPKRPSSEIPNAKDSIASIASKVSSQPLQNYDPHVWGVLTAISDNARKRPQGINMILTSDEHYIGRVVEDSRFQIESYSVSAKHCVIFRKKVAREDDKESSNCNTSVFLKDTSTNGTYINWKKAKKGSLEEVRHGDIISLAAPPQHEVAFAFVYREVLTPVGKDGAISKRKAEELVAENKRLKGIGLGAPEGPISLDDFRSLQRSNTDLRKQLENQVITIDKLQNENRAIIERHENEMKEMKESISKSYADQLKELHHMVEIKQNELVEVNRISAEQKHAIEDLNERLSASTQSCNEANEIMNSQKASIAELKEQLDEEREQRREEREKAAADLKTAVQRALSEAEEEIKRSSDAALRREREQQEVINKLQESERDRCLLVETLRSKLEDTRQKLVVSENKVRQLETQVCEVQSASESGKKRVEELELKSKQLRKELESEKQAAREEAWAKVSALELEINAAMRDLDFERRRLKGARERIMLRETQLRAFYSTTEEISVLFAKQQEQLKAMQRTLEDQENYDNTSIDIDLNLPVGDINRSQHLEEAATEDPTNRVTKAGSSARGIGIIQVETSSDEASVTEKHDCGVGSQGGHQNTQEAEEFTSAADNRVKGGFGSDIDGVGTAPVGDGDDVGTEQVPETESPGISEQNIDLNKSGNFQGDTMQLDEEAHLQEADEQGQMSCQGETLRNSETNSPLENQKGMEDTEAGGTIGTADLLASEVAGSWACSTAPSVHGDNDSPGRDDNDGASATLHDSNLQVAESQSNPSSEAALVRWNHERQALCEMIGIVAPDLKEQFGGGMSEDRSEDNDQQGGSNSDTESCSDNDEEKRADTKGGSISDAETVGSYQDDENQKLNDAMDEDK